MTRSRPPWLTVVVEATHRIRREILTHLDGPSGRSPWPHLFGLFTQQCGVDDAARFADASAQAITCALRAAAIGGDEWAGASTRDWLLAGADPLVRQILCESFWASPAGGGTDQSLQIPRALHQYLSVARVNGLDAPFAATAGSANQLPYFYEAFLRGYDGAARRRHGVFYTPSSLVSFIIANTDQMLKQEFHLADGLTDAATWSDMAARFGSTAPPAAVPRNVPFVRVLDPAMGTGVFLLEIIEQAYLQFAAAGHGTAPKSADAWTDVVNTRLLPRLHGLELMLAPVVLAHLLLARCLARTSYRFEQPQMSRLFLADTLRTPNPLRTRVTDSASPFTVIVGNPPFAGISHNTPGWVNRLLHGVGPEGGAFASYFDMPEAPLGERKHWLQDDYVKFLRLAHWHVERAGTGLIGLLTNHGFLDNVTFRAMRYRLLATFPLISVVDLHGNKRKGERAPDGARDEGVFAIGQGVAVTLLRRPPHDKVARHAEYAELWGGQQAKCDRLEAIPFGKLPRHAVAPEHPYFLLVPRPGARCARYGRGFCLPDAMPVNSTAAVTARDGFIIAFRREDLVERLQEFADPRVSDQVIRAKYFRNTRSVKYAAGDTRGWKLTEARRRLAHTPDWERAIHAFQYRPFDRRWICWIPWLIDWPRRAVMHNMEIPGNRALVARRQAPAASTYDYFWVSDTWVVDGLIRSDNRGGESVFPLYIHDHPRTPPGPNLRTVVRNSRGPVNFSDAFIARCNRVLRLDWVSTTGPGVPGSFTADDVFHYLIALFFSRPYRTRYRDFLQLDFPRILLPSRHDVWHVLCGHGAALADAILAGAAGPSAGRRPAAGSPQVAPGYPRHDGTAIWVNSRYRVAVVSESVWRYRVGTYRVCEKWWKARRGRALSDQDIDEFHRIVRAITQIQSIVDRIDASIEAAGGWETVFADPTAS